MSAVSRSHWPSSWASRTKGRSKGYGVEIVLIIVGHGPRRCRGDDIERAENHARAVSDQTEARNVIDVQPLPALRRTGDSPWSDNALAASHGELRVKGGTQLRIGQTPKTVAVSEVGARLHDAARFRARSTSHTVAVRDGCTKIPLAAGMGSGGRNHSVDRHFGHGCYRFVHPDPPELIRFWKIC